MSEVKRYDSQHEGWNYEDERGEYVLFTDYKSERLAHEETKKRLEELEGKILNAQNADSYDFLTNLQDEIARARSKS